jgi:hypothetical protein
MRLIVKDRKVAKDKRDAFEAIVDVYKHALGMLNDLPLGQGQLEASVRELRRTDRTHRR